MTSLDTSDHVFRIALNSSSSWNGCALGQLNPSIASRIAKAFSNTIREAVHSEEEFHNAVLREIGDPAIEPLYRLGIAFDKAVEEEWPVDSDGNARDIYEIDSYEFPTSRAIFDEIARLSEGSTVG